MRDGERRECPIVENKCIELSFGLGHVLVSASCDSIQMFPEPAYTHLRLFDNGFMKALFLDEEIMADLADMGIPVTIRDSITESEHEGYMNFMQQKARAELDDELDRFFD